MNLRDDPLQQQLRSVLRARLADAAAKRDAGVAGIAVHEEPADPGATCPSWAVLTELGAPLFELPAELGGLGLGLGAALVVCEELGRVALSGPYRAVAHALDRVGPDCDPDQVARIAEADPGALAEAGRVTALPGGWATGEPAAARNEIRQAAYLLGLAEGAKAAALAYAHGRRQFGRILHDFQAIAFALAGITTTLHATRVLVYDAGARADTGEPFAGAAAEALAMAAETALQGTRTAVHVCGVRGMTDELPLHRHYRLARDESVRLGPPAALWHRAGQACLYG